MRVAHVITTLETGGAQWVLVNLARQLQAAGHQQMVVCLKPGGDLASNLQGLGIEVQETDTKPAFFGRALRQIQVYLDAYKPDVIQSWMYHADFVTNFLHQRHPVPIVWGIHHTYEGDRYSRLKQMTKFIVRANSLFAGRTPAAVVCCSESARASHARIGYALDKLHVIENGIDIAQFVPDPEAGKQLRQHLGIPLSSPLVGLIARLHPQKDHGTFFQAANHLLQLQPDVHFILAGEGITRENAALLGMLPSPALYKQVHLLGKREDIAQITAGLDIAVLSASGDEAFPLTLLEAMACAVPVVSTAVGDVGRIVGEGAGRVVPPRNPLQLAEAIDSLLRLAPVQRAAMGTVGRQRVLGHFSVQRMAERYFQLYKELI
ncbi:MAG: glycosyltransferase [Anaerolineae bacterium]|nr:glycosyltransferase [Anaerolineae bacterium]